MPITFTSAFLEFQETGRQLGNGAGGDVVEIYDPQMKATFAMKKAPKHLFGGNVNLFFEEAQKLHLTRHPNVAEIRYACQDQDYVYICMPLYGKGSIADQFENRFLTAKEIVQHSLDFLAGLNHVHSKGLLHFDVKPENVMIADSGQALLSDFGLAQYMGNYGFAVQRGTTPPFAPPEYFQQAAHNVKFDIYQAGVTMHRMCTLASAFNREYHAAATVGGIFDEAHIQAPIIAGTFPDRTAFFPHISLPLRRIIKRALSVDPNDRYGTVNQFLNDVALLPGESVWQFDTNFTDSQTWTKPDYIVTATFANNSWTTEASKRNRRNTLFCQNGLTEGAKNQLMYRCLNTIW